jgi:hypothetical protein
MSSPLDYISRPPDPRAEDNSFYQILHAYLRLELWIRIRVGELVSS